MAIRDVKFIPVFAATLTQMDQSFCLVRKSPKATGNHGGRVAVLSTRAGW